MNYRTGSLLLKAPRLQCIDPETGKKDRKLQPPVDTSFASFHPSLPVTLYCRFERIPGDGSSWQWEKRYIFEFYHEDTQERVMNACGWKQTPFKAFFHGDDCYVQEIGGVIHKLIVHTAEQAWVTTLKNRGNNMFGGGFHEGRQCVVLKVGIHDAILFMDPASGETIKHQLAPHSWGAFTSLNCLVDNNTKLLLMDGRMFDVDTLELVEEGVFASMGLIFGPLEKWGLLSRAMGVGYENCQSIKVAREPDCDGPEYQTEATAPAMSA